MIAKEFTMIKAMFIRREPVRLMKLAPSDPMFSNRSVKESFSVKLNIASYMKSVGYMSLWFRSFSTDMNPKALLGMFGTFSSMRWIVNCWEFSIDQRSCRDLFVIIEATESTTMVEAVTTVARVTSFSI